MSRDRPVSDSLRNDSVAVQQISLPPPAAEAHRAQWQRACLGEPTCRSVRSRWVASSSAILWGRHTDEGPGLDSQSDPRALGAQRLWEAIVQALYACLAQALSSAVGRGAWGRCRGRPIGSTIAVAARCRFSSARDVTTVTFTARASVRGFAVASRCSGRAHATNTHVMGRLATPPGSAPGAQATRK